MKHLLTLLLLLGVASSALGQIGGTVQNRPYTDLRPFHFGILVGTHLQDIEMRNVGPQTMTADDGTTYESIVTADEDRWDPGLNVGVLGEARLTENFQFRIAPAIYFGNRHISFRDLTHRDSKGNPTEKNQDLKTVYVSAAFDLIFSGPRNGNHRPYLMAGLNPMINLSNHRDDFLELKKQDLYLEIGAGCDFYLEFFKLRPELKFLYSLTDSYNSSHINDIKDVNMMPFARSVNRSRTKMFVLTIYFE